MLFEHLIYSTAIAIIVGMIHFNYTGRDYSWIIIASAYIPDLDILANTLLKKLGMLVLMDGFPIKHGDFHDITMLFLFAILVSLILQVMGYRFVETFAFAGIGFGAHILEDGLVYNLGIVDYKPDLYYFADTGVLIFGLIAVLASTTIRIAYEGQGWINKEIKTVVIILAVLILMIPVLDALDISVIDEMTSSSKSSPFYFYPEDAKFLDNWQFGKYTSWDSTIFHSGNHSGKIMIPGNESKISGIFQSTVIPARPNTNYLFSSWGKTMDAYGTNSPAVRIVELDRNKKFIKQTNLIYGKGTNGWIEKNISIRSNANTRWVYIYSNIWKGYGTFWFDDVGLYETGNNTNLIPDPGIENGRVIELARFPLFSVK
ncbi:MAG: hypothetical protein OIN83_00165 [Candidatus Methanoperedens sp.]|nr:hypothetical protein [Candidatus Methanoperedens sp.]